MAQNLADRDAIVLGQGNQVNELHDGINDSMYAIQNESNADREEVPESSASNTIVANLCIKALEAIDQASKGELPESVDPHAYKFIASLLEKNVAIPDPTAGNLRGQSVEEKAAMIEVLESNTYPNEGYSAETIYLALRRFKNSFNHQSCIERVEEYKELLEEEEEKVARLETQLEDERSRFHDLNEQKNAAEASNTQEINRLQEENKRLNQEIGKLWSSMQSTLQKNRSLDSKLANAESKVASSEGLLQDSSAKIETLERDMQRKESAYNSDMQKMKSKVLDLEHRVGEYTAEITNLNISIQSIGDQNDEDCRSSEREKNDLRAQLQDVSSRLKLRVESIGRLRAFVAQQITLRIQTEVCSSIGLSIVRANAESRHKVYMRTLCRLYSFASTIARFQGGYRLRTERMERDYAAKEQASNTLVSSLQENQQSLLQELEQERRERGRLESRLDCVPLRHVMELEAMHRRHEESMNQESIQHSLRESKLRNELATKADAERRQLVDSMHQERSLEIERIQHEADSKRRTDLEDLKLELLTNHNNQLVQSEQSFSVKLKRLEQELDREGGSALLRLNRHHRRQSHRLRLSTASKHAHQLQLLQDSLNVKHLAELDRQRIDMQAMHDSESKTRIETIMAQNQETCDSAVEEAVASTRIEHEAQLEQQRESMRSHFRQQGKRLIIHLESRGQALLKESMSQMAASSESAVRSAEESMVAAHKEELARLQRESKSTHASELQKLRENLEREYRNASRADGRVVSELVVEMLLCRASTARPGLNFLRLLDFFREVYDSTEQETLDGFDVDWQLSSNGRIHNAESAMFIMVCANQDLAGFPSIVETWINNASMPNADAGIRSFASGFWLQELFGIAKSHRHRIQLPTKQIHLGLLRCIEGIVRLRNGFCIRKAGLLLQRYNETMEDQRPDSILLRSLHQWLTAAVASPPACASLSSIIQQVAPAGCSFQEDGTGRTIIRDGDQMILLDPSENLTTVTVFDQGDWLRESNTRWNQSAIRDVYNFSPTRLWEVPHVSIHSPHSLSDEWVEFLGGEEDVLVSMALAKDIAELHGWGDL